MTQSSASHAVEQVLLPPVRDLGDGFSVRRALPSPQRRMVGPFIFLDEFGPTHFTGGHGLDVRPHPHIGLATVTYLFEGAILHRDSLASEREIRPGAVNWMTAGRGIVHSERTPPVERAEGGALSGLQVWVALPAAHEEVEPAFAHYPADAVPKVDGEGVSLALIAGSAGALRSPVGTFSDLVYADVALAAGARWQVPGDHVERALYLVSGRVEVDGAAHDPGVLLVLKPGADIVVRALEPARLALAGGEPFPERRHIEWNFVSSRPERIAQAREDWRDRRFPAVPGDEHEFIPLPDPPAPPVRYP